MNNFNIETLLIQLRTDKVMSKFVSKEDLYTSLNADRKEAAEVIKYLLREIEELKYEG